MRDLSPEDIATNSSSAKFDVFADLTNGAGDALDSLTQQSPLRALAQTITCVVDPTTSHLANFQDFGIRIYATGMPVAAFADAVESARSQQRHLLVLIGSTVDPDVIARLASAFNADPMIGFAIPRVADPNGDGILPLPSAEAEQFLRGYSHNILRHLRPLQLAPEFVAACVLIRSQIVANVPSVDKTFSTVAAALLQLMIWSRRRGYRTAIVNHAVIANPTSRVAYPIPNLEERAHLLKQYPDLPRAETKFAELSCHRREALLALALSSIPEERRRLLLDCRGMAPGFNGTTECILGILVGLSLLNTDWSVTILASAEASSFHGLRERFRNFNIISELDNRLYAAAIRLSQPWTLHQLIELHRHAFLVTVNMLDTISWDIISPADIEHLWSFVAKYFDGILYISSFTRDRFNFRFPVASDVREAVTYLSFDYDDYRDGKIRASEDRAHILLVGNDYDHKGIAQAMDSLADAFPYERFVVVGTSREIRANVKYLESGKIPQAKIDQLYAGAKMLIFPSFYEGFGLPVVKGLSYGLDVVARRSALLYEVGAYCAPNGRVIPFDNPLSLVIAVGRILAGKPVETVPLGAAINVGEKPLNWRDVASRMLNFLEALTAETTTRKHDMRESALSLVQR